MNGLIERRISLLFALFAVLLCVGLVRAAYFGAVRAPSLQRAAVTQQVQTVLVPARRGAITDRHGIELAVSEPAESVAATPYLIKDPAGAAKQLSPLLGVPIGSLFKKLVAQHTGFVYLARKLPADQAHRIEALHIAGLQFIAETRRVYPQDWLAAQLLGTVGTDGNGLAGLEYSQDRVLRGRDGQRRLVRDAIGQPIALRELRPSLPGGDIGLTIDSAVQAKVEDVLQGVGETFRPKGATAVVMDPRTGAILALANWPRVNANDPSGAPAYALTDRAVGSSYEPGSTFKAVTVAGALEDGRVTPETSFDLAPSIQVADRTINEAEARGSVTLTTAQILAHSSNVGAVTIGLREGRTGFDSWVRRFGFGRPTGIELPGEATGIVPKLAAYSGSSMGNLPIGQGLAVTPLQMASAYSAIANGGVIHPPQILRAIGPRRVAPRHARRVISPRTAASLRSMLEGVLAPGGTASEVSIPGYKLAGKTGTANKPVPGGYSSSKYVASFVGFAPASAPRLLVAVMVDEPQGSIFGSQVEAPAFQKITAFALPYLRIPPA